MLFGALVFLTAPFVHASPRFAARLFEDFARSEWESRLDLAQAAARTDSVERAALYMVHAEDETRHTRMFKKRAGELDARYGGSARVEAQVVPSGLFERLGELDFLAFVHHGETRALEELEARCTILRASGDLRSLDVLEAILVDERRHASYTLAMLVELVGPREARQRVRQQQVREAGRLFRGRGLALARPLLALGLHALYLLAGPLLALATLSSRTSRR